MTSAPATIWGRFSRTESRTFSSCLNQSRAPRENRSYHLVRPEPEVLLPLRSSMVVTLLLCKQCRHVAQRFLCTVFVITVFADQPLLYHRDLLAGIVIRPSR